MTPPDDHTGALVPSRGGVEVAVHRLGGRGPLLLLAHATGFPVGAYRPLVAAGLADRFTCVGVDMRGHGRSRWPGDLAFAWDDFGHDVLAALDAVAEGTAGGEVYGFGHSLGGAALLLACAYRPGVFRKLFLYEPVVYPPDRDDHARQSAVQAATARRRVTFSSRQEALANFAGKPPLDSISADSLAAYVDDGFAPAGDGSVSLRCPPAVEAEVYRTSPLSSVDARLVDVACPVIVASGEGPPGLATDAARIVSRLARGRHLPMSGLGHLGPFQDPPAVARAVVEALVG